MTNTLKIVKKCSTRFEFPDHNGNAYTVYGSDIIGKTFINVHLITGETLRSSTYYGYAFRISSISKNMYVFYNGNYPYLLDFGSMTVARFNNEQLLRML